MMDFIITHATPLCWTIGFLYAVGLAVIWSCLAMSKKCDEVNNTIGGRYESD